MFLIHNKCVFFDFVRLFDVIISMGLLYIVCWEVTGRTTLRSKGQTSRSLGPGMRTLFSAHIFVKKSIDSRKSKKTRVIHVPCCMCRKIQYTAKMRTFWDNWTTVFEAVQHRLCSLGGRLVCRSQPWPLAMLAVHKTLFSRQLWAPVRQTMQQVKQQSTGAAVTVILVPDTISFTYLLTYLLEVNASTGRGTYRVTVLRYTTICC